MGRRPGSHIRNPLRGPVSSSVSSWLNFTPLMFEPFAWYDAADTATITESGGAVSQWDDKSGNGRHVSQGTASRQPITGTRTLNNKNVLDFVSADGLFSANLNQAQPFTIFGVAQSDVLLPANSQFVGNDVGAPTIFINGAGGWSIFALTILNSNVVNDTNSHVLSAIFNGASSSLSLDKRIIATGNAGTAGLVNKRIVLGLSGGDLSSVWDGTIAEIIYYSKILTLNQILVVETYLANKWGLGF